MSFLKKNTNEKKRLASMEKNLVLAFWFTGNFGGKNGLSDVLGGKNGLSDFFLEEIHGLFMFTNN